MNIEIEKNQETYTGQLIVFEGIDGSGKAQPLYSKIKIPNGWRTIGEMVVGDEVCTPDGKTAKVIGVFPQEGLRPIYRITFEDGRTTDCDENHLWKVYCDSWSRRYRNSHKEIYKIENCERIFSLKQLIKWKNFHKEGIFIPLSSPVKGEDRDLPLDPYVLGLLLGDGSFRGLIGFTNVDFENIKNLENRLIKGYKLTQNKINYNIVRTDDNSDQNNFYCQIIKEFKLWNKHSHEKFIPEIYKESSVEQRLELLRGLMDTDGEVNKGKCQNLKHINKHAGGSVSYSTSSHQLALDVQYLVRSLGGLCTIRIKRSFYKTKEGIRKECKTRFKCCIRHEHPEIFIRLTRKSERAVRSLPITLRCKIKDIKYIGIQKTQCIMLDSEDHLYITDGFIVTHNSSGAKNVSLQLKKEGYDVINFAEPSDGIFGKQIREAASLGELPPSSILVDLFIKDRAENRDKNLLPALKAGKLVLLDRYFYSSIAYQGVDLSPEYVFECNKPVILNPDITFIFDVDVDISLSRISKNRGKTTGFEKKEYLQKVKAIYDGLKSPNIRRVDAHRDLKNVCEEVHTIIINFLFDRREKEIECPGKTLDSGVNRVSI